MSAFLFKNVSFKLLQNSSVLVSETKKKESKYLPDWHPLDLKKSIYIVHRNRHLASPLNVPGPSLHILIPGSKRQPSFLLPVRDLHRCFCFLHGVGLLYQQTAAQGKSIRAETTLMYSTQNMYLCYCHPLYQEYQHYIYLHLRSIHIYKTGKRRFYYLH